MDYVNRQDGKMRKKAHRIGENAGYRRIYPFHFTHSFWDFLKYRRIMSHEQQPGNYCGKVQPGSVKKQQPLTPNMFSATYQKMKKRSRTGRIYVIK